MEIKTEADSNDITEYPCDTLPSVGMFGLFHMVRGGKMSTVWPLRQLASK